MLRNAALDLAALRIASARAPRSPAGARPNHRAPARRFPRAALITALATAAILLTLGSTTTLAVTTVTPKCDAVNLRTGPSTTYARKASVNQGAKLIVAASVTGGSYSVTCAGVVQAGTTWYRISSINGRSVASLYGVTYVYGANKLLKTIATPTPAPTAVPTAAPTAPPTAPPTAAPTLAPTAAPTMAPTIAPTTDPGATAVASPSPGPTPTSPLIPTAVPTATPAPTAITGPVTLPSTITVYGRGYGHGVGLSQYGAQGRALDGQSAATILAHYYMGTVLGTLAEPQVRVLVLSTFKASATSPVQVYGRGGSWSIDGVAKVFPADARLRFIPTTSGTTTTWNALVTAADGSVLHDHSTAASIRVRPDSTATLQLWSKASAYDRYRGYLRLDGKTDATATVNVVNEVKMETYLKGVVPAEVSASWPAEAVRAQAIAARSYAAYRLHPTTGSYDMYDDTRSQMYLGSFVEKSGSNAAISATAGVVLRTSTGGIANALFHSAGGGATENNENVFVSATGAKTAGVYSYLRGSMDRRPDGTPYDQASPFDTWSTRTYTLAQLQAWFAADSRSNVGTLVTLDLRDRGVSGRLISVTLIGANGTTKKVSGDVFRSIFNAHRPSADPMMRSSLFALAPIP